MRQRPLGVDFGHCDRSRLRASVAPAHAGRVKGFSIGVHLTLTCEYRGYCWRGLTNGASLHDDEGFLPATTMLALQRITAAVRVALVATPSTMDRKVATLALWLEPRSSQFTISSRSSGPYPRRSAKLGCPISILQRVRLVRPEH
jgi:hypothetical protein